MAVFPQMAPLTPIFTFSRALGSSSFFRSDRAQPSSLYWGATINMVRCSFRWSPRDLFALLVPPFSWFPTISFLLCQLVSILPPLSPHPCPSGRSVEFEHRPLAFLIHGVLAHFQRPKVLDFLGRDPPIDPNQATPRRRSILISPKNSREFSICSPSTPPTFSREPHLPLPSTGHPLSSHYHHESRLFLANGQGPFLRAELPNLFTQRVGSCLFRVEQPARRIFPCPPPIISR